MRVIYGGSKCVPLKEQTACALGFFDGVHSGHQNLINILNKESVNSNLKSMVFTFEKHPMSIINKDKAPKLIMDNESKISVFESLNIELAYFQRVDRNFISMEPEVFLTDILVKQLNVRSIIAGFNFRFGYQGRGNSDTLINFSKKTGIHVHIVEPFSIDGIVVSSTNIRSFIGDGNISAANKFLNREYSMHGKVIHGYERGRNIGFPTANIEYNEELLIPKNGVYVTKVCVDGSEMVGITNVGKNPTFNNNLTTIETHIIGLNGDLYGKFIKVKFYDRLRDENRYNSPIELTEQLNKDKLNALAYFKY
jgi:riboflavin kinase/FMN adenylyltransferase